MQILKKIAILVIIIIAANNLARAATAMEPRPRLRGESPFRGDDMSLRGDKSLATAYPGGIAKIPLPSAKQPPEVTYQGNRILVLEQAPKQWLAVVGVSLQTKPGTHHITLTATKQAIPFSVPFTVTAKHYPEEWLTVKNQDYVTPTKTQLERINKENLQLQQAYASFREQPLSSLTMQLPTQGRLSSPFGLQRYFNKQPRNPHSGLDIAAKTGTPVHPAMKGKVIVADHFYFNGNTVVLDHGQGLKSVYCHLSSIEVQVGDELSTSDQLGKVGQTGRVTGPHLHWTVILNNTQVDPQSFI